MLAKRIIPCLDVDHGRVVKGKQFANIKDVDDPVKLGKRYSELGADELVFYDITASSDERDIFIHTVEDIAKEVSIPFTIGGGIRTVEDFRKVLLAGADKVSVNSSAVTNPSIISDGAKRFGSQCVVLSIDAKRNDKNSWDVYVKGGRENTYIDAVEWAKKGEDLGAGEICINSIDTDGVKNGFDLELIEKLNSILSIPIIASGGAGRMEHFLEVLKSGADAALAASVFHFGEIDIMELKEYLKDNSIEMRL
ncbi:imidazole glycerol phosphate synthase subunit HisF [Anaerofustis stercorihominis]|uniref:Imidazole glycerol phosphate synthase subunit HisF n=2 Tax=Anaerofustis stercorihominis TaxID=214853 RepID=B1CBW9_9FIRM|nr:imidazole glycerol phosphate synthase subunit HisF [Anaerofustis stercorihominis]EDS71766.1 imidazoleglycerol phosphate synthase, cyclase subunit [Anaerofustis stercorihominis DSM 17244]MCQ4796180.1 imidazole glycerol phosphate synthase subunit HisF [Anaerofustis stercorihominis]RGD75156.1 imidazole glycerol phosphate synthase subunit HisF [Anaerofustis stercorihominis]